MAGVSGAGASSRDNGVRDKLVRRGNRLVVSDGRLVMGPCAKEEEPQPFVWPISESIFALYEGVYYMPHRAFLKGTSVAGEGVSAASPIFGEGGTFRNVIEMGTKTDAFGGVVYVKFDRTPFYFLPEPRTFVIGAFAWKVTWPSYNVSHYEITGEFGLDDIRDEDKMNEYFGASVWNEGGWYNEGDCRGFIRRYGTLESYDGPTAKIEPHKMRNGQLKWDANGRVTNFT